MGLILKAGKGVLKGVYSLYKLAATKDNRISIISRQSNIPSTDIQLLRYELLKQEPGLDVRVLCKTLENGISAKALYILHMLCEQLPSIATSKVLLLDSYCIAASVLDHKSDLTIIQMWHAMGALKKFGKSIIDEGEGTPAELAEAMEMHRNYDHILASSEESARCFGEAFGYGRSSFRINPLPRTDLLRSDLYIQKKREEIVKSVLGLEGKKVILYAPTFRTDSIGITKLMELADEVRKHPEYVLVFSHHPNMLEEVSKRQRQLEEKGVITTSAFSSMELLAACDYFVSDYSAVIYEAALVGKPMFLYAYDRLSYQVRRGFYLDYETEMPAKPVRNASAIMEQIMNDDYDMEKIKAFADRYIDDMQECTRHLASWILSLMKDQN
jgi:CDP-ribitol ribitolphosphotransferase